METYDERTENDEICDFYFEHIYNGIIFKDDSYFAMIEFKVIKNKNANVLLDHDVKFKDVNFKDVDYKCAWFTISFDKNGINRLIGPIRLNLDLLQQNKIRSISDDRYPEINEMVIESLSNDEYDLIGTDFIPDWMMDCLMTSIVSVDIK